MVQPQGIHPGGGALHPADPPAETVRLHGAPVVERIAPELAVGGEVVRRHPCHLGGSPCPVQQKLFPLAPDVGAVQGDVDGQITDQLHAPGVHIRLERRPLGVEPVLHGGVEGHVLRQYRPPVLQRRCLMAPQGLVRPEIPGGVLEMGLGRLIQSVFFHPGIPVRKVPGRLGPLPAEAGKCLAQQAVSALVHSSVLHRLSLRRPGRLQLRLGQQSLRRQGLQVDEQRVARKGGDAGVGGVPRAGGAHRQNLPPGLPGGLQEVRKRPGLAAQRTDAVGSRQGKNRHEDTGCTLHGDTLLF